MTTNNTNINDEMLALYRQWFDVDETDTDIYVTCARATSDIDIDYTVSLELVTTDEDNGAEEFAVDNGLLTDEDIDEGKTVNVWAADDPQNREYFATREEAMDHFVMMIDGYIEGETDLYQMLAEGGSELGGAYDWITEGIDSADITNETQAHEAITETIVTALTVAHDHSEAFARYIVAENPRFIAGLVANVMDTRNS